MMLKNNLTIIMLLLAFTIFGQTLMLESDVLRQQFGTDFYYKDKKSNTSLNGHYKIADDRGNYQDVHFKNGKKDGKVTQYDYAGRKTSQTTYKQGKTNGKYIGFHQNKTIRKQGDFLNGKQIGKWEEFDDKGKLLSYKNYNSYGNEDGKSWKHLYGNFGESDVIKYYKNGQLVGHAEEKSISGKIRWECEYVNSLSFTEKKYYPNGKLKQKRTLKDNKLEGEFLIYDQSGILLDEKIFRNDFLTQHTVFYNNGKKEEVRNYKNGKLNGICEQYGELGTKTRVGRYKDNYKTGVWKRYNDQSKHILTETTYMNGVKNGLYRKYNKAVKVSIEGNYKNRERNGLWKYYDLAGKLIKETTYDMGRKVIVKEYK